MKIIEGRVRISASDVANFLACQELTQLDLQAAHRTLRPPHAVDLGFEELVDLVEGRQNFKALARTSRFQVAAIERRIDPDRHARLEQPLHLKNPAIVSTKPRTYIECFSGGFFSLPVQRLVAHLLGPRGLPPTEAGWRLRQLPTGHDAMITMPKELADLLLEVV